MDGQFSEPEATTAEACRALKITINALYRQIWAGRLPARRHDGRWRIPLTAIEQRLAQKAARQ